MNLSNHLKSSQVIKLEDNSRQGRGWTIFKACEYLQTAGEAFYELHQNNAMHSLYRYTKALKLSNTQRLTTNLFRGREVIVKYL